HRREAALARDAEVGVDRLGDAGPPEAHAEVLEAREARALGLRAAAVLAGQHAAGERAVREQRHALAKQHLGEVAVDAARDEAVAVLQRDWPRRAELLRRLPERAHAPRGLVREAPVADLLR